MLIHETGPGHIWTGNSKEIAETAAIPRKWFPGALPTLQNGEYAKWAGGTWVVVSSRPAPHVPVELINQERDRRIALGFDHAGHAFQSDSESLSNITGASTSALAYLVAGGDAANANWAGGPFTWLASDNVSVPMTAPEMIALGNAAMAHKSAHIHAARAIKAMNPIPADFTDDKYWP